MQVLGDKSKAADFRSSLEIEGEIMQIYSNLGFV